MKQLTIRGVGDDLHRALRERAEQQDVSVNHYVLQLLHRAMGLSNGATLREVEYDDLDHLAGSWSREEYEAFQKHLASQRVIDEELWN